MPCTITYYKNWLTGGGTLRPNLISCGASCLSPMQIQRAVSSPCGSHIGWVGWSCSLPSLPPPPGASGCSPQWRHDSGLTRSDQSHSWQRRGQRDSSFHCIPQNIFPHAKNYSRCNVYQRPVNNKNIGLLPLCWCWDMDSKTSWHCFSIQLL